VGSFQWQNVSDGEVLDKRCQLLPATDVGIHLPIALRLGATESDVLKILGPPTARKGGGLIYVHEHKESIRGEPYTSSNIVAILLRGGVVSSIAVSKTTSS
jgi:hypothetical protein